MQEDAESSSDLVRHLINQAGLSHRSVLLNMKTPTDFKLTNKDPHWSKPRGVSSFKRIETKNMFLKFYDFLGRAKKLCLNMDTAKNEKRTWTFDCVFYG